jgi:hypothetical protein
MTATVNFGSGITRTIRGGNDNPIVYSLNSVGKTAERDSKQIQHLFFISLALFLSPFDTSCLGPAPTYANVLCLHHSRRYPVGDAIQ